ncbi:MAG: hypothetical protein HY582_02805 [Candidatus Omnitrophica bacterium]|nr:hypothetical protein [Candidatus Omnitrophota bacterium]
MKKRQRKRHIITELDYLLTEKQEQILRTQIRRNSQFIDLLLKKIDLLANRERCPKDANTLVHLRKQVAIEMEENDNFRKVLWKNQQATASWKQMPDSLPDPITFLVARIRSRQKAALAGACMK